MYSPIPEPTPFAQSTLADRYEPTVGRMVRAGISEGFSMTTPGLVASSWDRFLATAGKPLGEPEWKQSEHYRPGLKYDAGMTEETAKLLSERYDRNAVSALLSERSGVGGTVAQILGSFIGSVPDPLNFIPIMGWAGLGEKVIARAGPILGHALLGGADAAIAVGLLQPLVAAEHALYQDPFDLQMAATNVALAAGIGGIFGGVRGGFARRGPDPAWAADRTPEEHVAAFSKAVADILDDRPVDVGPVFGPTNALPKRLRAALDIIRRTPDLPESIRVAAGRLESEADIQVQAKALLDRSGVTLDALSTEGVLRGADDLVVLKDRQITDEMRAVAADYARVKAEVNNVLSTPGFERDATAKFLANAAENGHLRAEYEAKMVDAIKAASPEPDPRTPADVLGEVADAAKTEETRLRAQAEELGKQADAAKGDIETPINPAREAQLLDAKADIEKQADALAELADQGEAGRAVAEPDMTVYKAAEPVEPEVQPLKESEIGQIDDTEIPMVEEQFAYLEEAGMLSEGAVERLEVAELAAARSSKMAQAVQRAMLCLMGP